MQKGTLTLAVVAAVAMLCVGTADAGVKIDVLGVAVSLSTPGTAYLDNTDGTLTIEPGFDGASIKVAAGKLAPFGWGTYCDVFVMGNNLVLSSIAMKGGSVHLYVVGQTYFCSSFKGSATSSGNTDAYGIDVGLGMDSAELDDWPWPKAVATKGGVFYAGCLGNTYFTSKGKGGATVLPAEGLSLLFGE